jgi:kinetochore protein Nuf2
MSNFLPTEYTNSQQTQHGGNAHTAFVFPLLKTGEIEQTMSELNIELSKTEMMEPQRHKEKLRKVFWQLMEVCCGILEDQLTANHTTSTEGMSYPELHEDGFTDLLFFQEVRQCMNTCGIHDFSWRDLHSPVSKRFRCQLSAFINLAKFREEQLKVYSELNEPRAHLLLQLEETFQENAQLTLQHEQVQAESAEKMDEMDKVIAECHHLESEIARCNKLQAAKREEAAALKREVNALKDELSSSTWALQEAQAEEEALMAKVVSSPDRRKQELESKKSRLEQAKEEIRNMQDELQLNKKKNFTLHQAIKTVHDTVALQKQLLDEAGKYEKVMGQLNETTKDIEGTVEKTEELENQMEEANRAFLRTEEKLAHMHKQGKMKMDAVLDRIDIAKDQLLLVEKERQDGAARVDAGEAEVRALEEQMKAEKEKTDREITELISEYKETEKAFMARNEKRMQFVDAAL